MTVSKDIYNTHDFMELLIKCLYRSKEVLTKARQIGLKGDDLLTSAEFGVRIYKVFTEIALNVAVGPIDQRLAGTYIRAAIEAGDIHANIVDQAAELYAWIYTDDPQSPITPEYFVEHLPRFIKHQREEKAKSTYTDNNELLRNELNKINVEVARESTYSQVQTISPFANLVKKEITHLIGTGLTRLDTALGGGLAHGEFGIIVGFSGGGKCHGINTPILMYDGSVKPVQNILSGELIMGNDSTPRRVLSIVKGAEQMYRITPVKGESWTCNESHILSLVTCRSLAPYKQHQIVNITVKNFLKLPPELKACLKLYRTGVNFKESPLLVDPYIIGCWLGDGSRHKPAITSGDKEIVNYLKTWANKNDLKMRKEPGQGCATYHFKNKTSTGHRSIFDKEIQRCMTDGLKSKFIPSNYLINSRKNRLELLAGLIDTDGHLHNNCYEVVSKYDTLAKNILYLARSLGFAAYNKPKIATLKSRNYSCRVNRITIAGDINQIPCKVKRKKAKKRKQVKNVLRTGFTVKKIKAKDYYGFELDGNHLYVLGDFTVTHNTALASNIATKCALEGKKVAYMSLEECYEDLSNRFYSQIFRIDYSSLHNGSGYMELEEKFGSLDAITDDHRRALETNLKVFALKGMAPMKPAQLYDILLKEFSVSGFAPDLVIVDQLQFLEPDEKVDGEQQWLREQRVAEDVDKFSHQKIGDHGFAVWALHQAKGKLKKNFTNDDIAGFKGIIHKPDSMLGIGRASPTSVDFEIFSIKSRHSKNFQLDYRGDLQFMTFEDGNTPAAPVTDSSRPTHGAGRVALSAAQLITRENANTQVENLDQVQQLLSPGVAT